MNWRLYHPIFEYQQILNQPSYPWLGHIYFAYDLVANIKPKVIVELGVARGISFFSFCQAIKDLKLKTKIYGIDTWQGDKHTGQYDQKIFSQVKNINSTYYPKLNTSLLKQTFDKVVPKFADSGIDLLHIDGYHTYEAVAHDYQTWLPKMSANGIILFHDIVEKRSDFGVYKLWKILQKKYSTYQFSHSHGLGVVFLGQKSPLADFIALDLEDYYKNYSLKEKHQIESRHKLVNQYQDTIQKIVKESAANDQKIKVQIRQLQKEIATMKSSKFWKMRDKYYRLLGRKID
ncbi:MAG: class I SAM-dependent methyltransferase [Patescibacteria group bacterium]